MSQLKIISLMTFAVGMAVLTKYYDFAEWIGKVPWIAFPMIVLGSLGICLLWGKED